VRAEDTKRLCEAHEAAIKRERARTAKWRRIARALQREADAYTERQMREAEAVKGYRTDDER
jgi:hypothetical protein